MTTETLSKDTYRHLVETALPGRILGDPFDDMSPFGVKFELFENRLPGVKPVRRFIYILPDAKDGEWYPRFLECVQRLTSTPLPHVAAPHESGLLDNGDAYLVADYLPIKISTQTDGGVSAEPARVLAVVEQILEGLAELHQRGIFHGNLQTKSIRLDRDAGDNDANAWIADAFLGGLPYWSRGTFSDPDARFYRPPESNGKPIEPSAQADLNALGLVVAEIWKGCGANPQRTDSPASRTHRLDALIRYRFWPMVANFLIGIVDFWHQRRNGASRALTNLTRSLLGNSEHPRDAVEMLSKLRRWKDRNGSTTWGIWAGRLLIVALVAWFAHLWAVRQELDVASAAAQEKIGKLIGDNEKLRKADSGAIKLSDDESAREAWRAILKSSDGLKDVRKQLEGAQEQIAKLTGDSEKLKKTDSGAIKLSDDEVLARTAWGEIARSAGDWKPAIDKWRNGNGPNEFVVRRIEEYYGAVKHRSTQMGEWKDARFEIIDLYRKAYSKPWDIKEASPFEDRLAALKEAAGIWADWARDESLRFDKDALVDATPTRYGDTKPILTKWLGELKQKQSWKVRLIRGRVDNGDCGIKRSFLWYIDKTRYSSRCDWDDPKSYDYPQDTTISINWSPGQSIQFRLWQSRSLSDYEMIAGPEFSGILALWKINNSGTITQDDRELDYEIVDCPGPPPRKEKDLKVAEEIWTGPPSH